MPGNINTGKVDIKGIVYKIESMQIITTENKAIKEKMHADFKALTDKDKSYEELMRIKDGKDTAITFKVKKEGNDIKELIMLIDDEHDFVAIQILGNFTIEDIQNITKDVNISVQ
jgi:Tol biopolymer transport system component